MFILLIILSAAIFLMWLTIYCSPQIFGQAIQSISTNEKIVALTYDDGPLPACTPELMNVLTKHNIHATFFVLGERAQRYPELVRALYQAGHEVGNHTWSHPILIGKSPDFIRKQIEDTDELLRKLGYAKEIYFRSPYGIKLLILPWVLAGMGRKNILFDVICWDWTSPGTDNMVKRILKNTKPGSIILLHDGCGNAQETIKTSDIIIKELKNRGYRFVTISEMLMLQKK